MKHLPGTPEEIRETTAVWMAVARYKTTTFQIANTIPILVIIDVVYVQVPHRSKVFFLVCHDLLDYVMKLLLNISIITAAQVFAATFKLLLSAILQSVHVCYSQNDMLHMCLYYIDPLNKLVSIAWMYLGY